MATHFPLETYACVWCGEPYSVDPQLRAFPYVCPECGESTNYETLKNPSPHQNAPSISEAAANAIAANVHNHSFAIINPFDSGSLIATGTLLVVRDRTFVITARHTIPAKPEQKLFFVSKKRSEPDGQVYPEIVCYEKEFETGPDVGFLEIESNDELQRLGAIPISLDRLADVGPGLVEKQMRIFGFPFDWITENRQKTHRQVCAMSLGSYVIDPQVWSTIDHETRHSNPDIHIILHFDMNDEYMTWGDHGHTTLAKPGGMSGGGCWQSIRSLDYAGIWTPEDQCLIAIQSSWPRHGRFLKAVQIIHWLRLLAVCYADLRGELVERFPRLKQYNLEEV